MDNTPIVLAYSGGLDTSFCIPWIKENYSKDVITLTVDTGGLSEEKKRKIKKRAIYLGAKEHYLIDSKDEYFEKIIKYLIAGNIKKGQLYPLCVGAERGLQAEKLASFMLEKNLQTVAHGCTAAGNDQIRFDVALKTINPKIKIIAPVRDNNWLREEQIDFLKKRKLYLDESETSYSINHGLWGVTIGGIETLDSCETIPEDAWPLSKSSFSSPRKPSQHKLIFDQGIPKKLNGKSYNPVQLIEKLEKIACEYAIGRGIHLGDTILGTKGRVAFEAPAAIILIEAHRELEKLVLSSHQIKAKEILSSIYGDLIHEGKQLDLVCEDIETFFSSSQRRVTGEVSFSLKPGNLFISGVKSKHSLLSASSGKYGEKIGDWSAEDARGFSNILSISGSLQSIASGD
jgi:argininosuccinate synthase|tara:strand:- start:220 stop:1422 length:1203 start_codon:yes stop_codon:yes gene_type:complete